MIHKFKIGDTKLVLDVNSGAVHIIDDIVYDILDEERMKDTEEIIGELSCKYSHSEIIEAVEEVKQLQNEGLLYSPDMYRDLPVFRERKPVIKAMCLHVVHDCNMRCQYCFASQGTFKGQKSFMSEEVGKRAIDFLIENSGDRRNLEIDFFGGEPLMNFDVVKKIVEYGRAREKEANKHFRFTITTNGLLLNDETIDYINENMDNVILSIDGRKEVNDRMRHTAEGLGTYDRILSKYKKMLCLRKDKLYFVRGTFTKYNLDFTNDVLHLADLGFKNISMEPVVVDEQIDYGIGYEDLPKVFEEYEKLAEAYLDRKDKENEFTFFHFLIDLNQGPCVIKRLAGCGAGTEYLAITPEGDMYPCHQFVGDSDFKMGNVFENTLDRNIGLQFKEAHVYNKKDCQSCWAKFYCSGGCHANAYQFNKDIQKPYQIGCEMEKKRIECALAIQAKLLAKEGLEND